MYSVADYKSTTAHPPLIAWSFDGLDVYGRYLYSTSLGQSVPLDACGGHIHAGVSGYHYHAQVVTLTGTSGTYNAYVGGVYNCWKGDISNTVLFGNSS